MNTHREGVTVFTYYRKARSIGKRVSQQEVNLRVNTTSDTVADIVDLSFKTRMTAFFYERTVGVKSVPINFEIEAPRQRFLDWLFNKPHVVLIERTVEVDMREMLTETPERKNTELQIAWDEARVIGWGEYGKR